MIQKKKHLPVKVTKIHEWSTWNWCPKRYIWFGWCFWSGFITGGLLRNQNTRSHFDLMVSAFTKFSQFSHISEENGGKVCIDSAKDLLWVAKLFEGSIPSACRLCYALADSASWGNRSFMRGIAHSAILVLIQSKKSRANFFSRFEELQDYSVDDCNSLHKNGNCLQGNIEENWLSNAERTGEIFPIKPQDWSGLSFGHSRTRRNQRIIRPKYLPFNVCVVIPKFWFCVRCSRWIEPSQRFWYWYRNLIFTGGMVLWQCLQHVKVYRSASYLGE